MSDSRNDYLKRADLIRKRLMERASKAAEKREDDPKKKDARSNSRPGSLTQKLKPILGRIDELTEESRKMNKRFQDDSKSGEFRKEDGERKR